MKKFNVLKFIIRMLKVGAFLTVGFTILLVVIAFVGMLNRWTNAEWQWRTLWDFWSGQLLGLGVGATAGFITALLVYGAAELLDLMITIQENTYSTVNVLRNMYRDQLNAQNVEAIHSTQARTVRLRDVDAEGNVVEADLSAAGSNGSKR